ncbi:MAG: hypothetical protein WDO17_18690 [Alphaproteobacteria bacterium]
MAKKAKTKRTAKKAKSKRPPKRTGAEVSPEVAKILARLHTSLKVDAKTPNERADASIVGAAQQHAAQGDIETVGSLLNKVSSWTTEKAKAFVSEHKDAFIHIAQHVALKALRGG